MRGLKPERPTGLEANFRSETRECTPSTEGAPTVPIPRSNTRSLPQLVQLQEKVQACC